MNIENLSLDYYCHRLKDPVDLLRKGLQAPASESEELKLLTLSSQMKCCLVYCQQLRICSIITRGCSLNRLGWGG